MRTLLVIAIAVVLVLGAYTACEERALGYPQAQGKYPFSIFTTPAACIYVTEDGFMVGISRVGQAGQLLACE